MRMTEIWRRHAVRRLKQIEEKKYAEGLKRRGAKKIIKYGIAFYEKECMVMTA